MADNYQVLHRNIKYPRLEFRTGKLQLILPVNTKPETIISKHKEWIKKKKSFIRKALVSAKKKKIINRTDIEFKKLLNNLVTVNSKDLNVKINKIFFRKMKTKWASLSKNRNLTVNVMMSNLPKDLINYIVAHELTHIIEKRHNERFWKILSKRFIKYPELEKELFEYWFLIQRSKYLGQT